MAKLLPRCYIIFLLSSATYLQAFDDIDFEAQNRSFDKLLRSMENQTNADTLNLPANSSSIRENITDTFSCENRTYGYYADVDNECQVFHVCLPSQTASGRNVTYRWSFICPNETIFNQEVLVCTRPRDAIDCADSPMYYDVNMDIGKVPETEDMNAENNINQETDTNKPTGANKETNENSAGTDNKDTTIQAKPQRRRPVNKKKQNITVESLMKEVIEDNLPMKSVELSHYKQDSPVLEENKPKIAYVDHEYVMNGDVGDVENSRIIAERSLKRKNRKIKRGSFRFKADV